MADSCWVGSGGARLGKGLVPPLSPDPRDESDQVTQPQHNLRSQSILGVRASLLPWGVSARTSGLNRHGDIPVQPREGV